MNIVPVDKHDFKTCEKLSKASDAEVIANLDELLGWTAGVNWPVASHVIDRLKTLGNELVLPLKKLLAGEDDTWKYFLIVHLLPVLREDVFSHLETDLQRIVSNPTASEILEEVYLEAKELADKKKLSKEVTIDILAFIREGKFDVLETGQTKDWVLNNFPTPDDFENGDSYKNGEFEIFNYGDFELHFFRDMLYLIFADFEGKIDGGDSLLLTHKWIFEKDTADLNLPYVIEALRKENIDFTTQKNDTLYSAILNLKSKVALHFETDCPYEKQEYQFKAAWITDKALLDV